MLQYRKKFGVRFTGANPVVRNLKCDVRKPSHRWRGSEGQFCRLMKLKMSNRNASGGEGLKVKFTDLKT